MSSFLVSLAVTLFLGIFAGIKLARGHAQYRDSRTFGLGNAAPAILGAILVYLLMRADPSDVYLPGLYLFGVGMGFLPKTFDSPKPMKTVK